MFFSFFQALYANPRICWSSRNRRFFHVAVVKKSPALQILLGANALVPGLPLYRDSPSRNDSKLWVTHCTEIRVDAFANPAPQKVMHGLGIQFL